MSNKILGALFIVVGLKVLFVKDWQGNWVNYEFSMHNLYIPVGLLCIYVGYLFFKIKETKEKNDSKCPKCKISYRYKNTNNGLCPTCNIKTIEIDEYYKKYPQELDDV